MSCKRSKKVKENDKKTIKVIDNIYTYIYISYNKYLQKF